MKPKSIMLKPDLLDPEKYSENQIEEAAETLLEAEEIKKDPVLMKNVKKFLEEKKTKITDLSQLREKANNFLNDKAAKEADEEESE